MLDTNVLMHDPVALFRFHEHDIFIPMVVLEELDRGKKGVSEVARNVRQVSRFIDELMATSTTHDISDGLALTHYSKLKDIKVSGKLFTKPRCYTASYLPDQSADGPYKLPTTAGCGSYHLIFISTLQEL